MYIKEIIGKATYLSKNKNKKQILCIGQVQSGKTRFIIEETEKAIDKNKYDCIIIGGTNNILLKQTQDRFKKNENLINYININLSDGYDIKKLELSDNKKAIIYTLKGDDALSKVKEFVKFNRWLSYLIIDDESDYGSLNINKKQGESTIYKHIVDLYELPDVVTYYSVTATPFANILGDSWNFDEVWYIKPGELYCGIDFFSKESLYEICDNFFTNDQKINEELIKEILIDHIKRILENNLVKSQILFNIDLKNDVQYEILKSIRKKLEILDKTIERYVPKENVENSFNIINSLIENSIILNENSTDEEKIKIKKQHSIIVGGNMVSRGFTFDDLITCVMLNQPSCSKYSADTLLQRCRWFGYRHKIVGSNIEQYKLMKIFITSNIFSSLKEARLLNDIVISNKDINSMKNEINDIKFDYIIPTNKSIKNG